MAVIVNDDLYPYSSVCYIEARWGNVWYSGSGVLVGRNDVLTASHVIYDIALGGIADEIIVYPSYDAVFHQMNGTYDDRSYSYAYAQYFTDFDPDGDGWLSPGDGTGSGLGGTELDVALIALSEAAGDSYGWMGMDFGFGGGNVEVTGHPGSLQYASSTTTGYTSPHSLEWIYSINSFGVSGGNSGGPVWYEGAGGPMVVGVVSTTGSAADITAHDWLLDAVKENDSYIRGEPTVEYITGTQFGLESHHLSGRSTNYDVQGTLQNATVIDLTGLEGTDHLQWVDRIIFQDGVLALDAEGNAGQAYRLYQTAFERTPDTEGLGYWIGRLDSGTTSLNAIADSFLNSPEFVRTYGTEQTVSDSQFVELLYLHTLGRNYDQSGFDYWVERLDNNQTNRGDLLAFFSESNENKAKVADAIDDGIWYA